MKPTQPVTPRREVGSAVVEFAVLGVVLLGVLVEIVVMFGMLQRATLATSAAAREVGRAVVLAGSLDGSLDDSSSRSAAVIDQAARNHGLAPGALRTSVEGVLTRGARLRVTVATEVPVVRIPFLGPVWPALAVPVESTHVVQVDRYRSFP